MRANLSLTFCLSLMLFANSAVSQNSRTASCPPNIDFEFGDLTNWETNTGKVFTPFTKAFTAPPCKRTNGVLDCAGGTPNIIEYDNVNWLNGIMITSPTSRHKIIDRNTSPPVDFYGGFTVNHPNGGRYSFKLGSDEPEFRSDPEKPYPNAKTESIRYYYKTPSTVTDNLSILFAYALVFEDPTNAFHDVDDRPSFRAIVYKANGGDTSECMNIKFVAAPNIDKFQTSLKSNRYSTDPGYSDVKYKGWSSLFVNLAKYPPNTDLFIEFTTTDCTLRGHFGYAYIDVIECNYEFKIKATCKTSTTA
ncbi:MAG: hypothetical protein KGP35_07240, partial [Bacteroidetes bacterium]|nr:hypothetical protein [Bacteroidota bacterium]